MNAPKLRFKEFDGDWLDSKIDDIAVVTSVVHQVEAIQSFGMEIFLGLQQALSILTSLIRLKNLLPNRV